MAAHKYARGIYVIFPNNDNGIDSQPAWTDPNIIGVGLRNYWSNIQPTATTFDWSYFDHGMNLALQYNKAVAMQIKGAEDATPAWLYQMGARSFPLVNGKNAPTTPWPDDPICQAQWSNLVQTWAARYDSSPALKMVTLWCGGDTIECFFANDTADVPTFNQFGGASAWLKGAQGLAANGSYFTTTQKWLAVGVPLAGDQNVTMTTFAQWFVAQWPGMAGVQSNALDENFPSGPNFAHVNVTAQSLGLIGFQFLNPVHSLPGQTVAGILANAKNYYAQWVQVYPGDPANDPGEGAIIAFNQGVDP